MRSGDLRDRIQLQRLTGTTTADAYTDLPDMPFVWAAVEPLGEERYRIRMRDRADLRTKADIEPAMRVRWRDRTLAVDDVTEVDRHKEVHLIAHQVLVDSEELATGARRTEAWPSV